MARYAALLRGINVGRNNRVAMADLRALLGGLGHAEVATLLRSGNAVFTSDSRDIAALAIAIEQAITRELGLTVGVVVVSRSDLARVVRDNPLAEQATDGSRYLVTFVSGPVDPTAFADIDAAAYEPERFALGPREIYLWMPDGVLDSRLSKIIPGRRLGTLVTTARNWNTVTKLQALLS